MYRVKCVSVIKFNDICIAHMYNVIKKSTYLLSDVLVIRDYFFSCNFISVNKNEFQRKQFMFEQEKLTT